MNKGAGHQAVMRKPRFLPIQHLYFILLFSFFINCCLFFNEACALDIKKKVLANGLTLLHSEKHSLPLVMMTMIVKAGMTDEPAEKAGLANLAAALLAEGTKARTSKVISEEVEFIGASLGTSSGGDYTVVSLSVLKKDIEKGLELFSDIILNPAFPEEELDRKRELIKGYLKQREEEPSYLAGRAFDKEVFGGHPYGRSAEGLLDTLPLINREDLTGFHSRFFIPNNSILSVVGDLSSGELDELISRHLGAWKRAEIPERRINPRPEARKNKVIKIEKDLTQANIIIGHLGISRDNPDYYAVMVMNYILGGGGFSSRLMQKIRDDMGLAYDVHSFFSAYKENGVFQAGVQTKNESANTAVDEILKQIKRIREEKVSARELSDAKAYLTGSFPRKLDTNRKIADFLAIVEFYNLGQDYIERYPSYINSVSEEDVLRVAQKYLDPENYVLVVVASQKKAGLRY